MVHREDPSVHLNSGETCLVTASMSGRGDTYPDMAWEPKAAFTAVAEYYRS